MTGDATEWPHFVGGYGEYFYVKPGSTIYKVPPKLPSKSSPARTAPWRRSSPGSSGRTFPSTRPW